VVPVPRNRLVFAGEAIVDLVMEIDSLPERGGDMLARSGSIQVGGGFNVMAAAARQGMPVWYAGGHGTGPWGDRVRAALAAEGIGILRPPDPDADTGFDVAFVEGDGERTFVTSIGAEMASAWDPIQPGPGDFVYVSGYGLAAHASGTVSASGTAPASITGLAAWTAALPPGVIVFVDPGPLVRDIPDLDVVLARCEWWSCNQREAALLTGTDDPAQAATRLLARTGRLGTDRLGTDRLGTGGVIVRAGAMGCVLATRACVLAVPAPAVRVADTTGAGDAHAGVFLAALAAGVAPPAAASRANVAAALAVSRHGPATAPTRQELDDFLRLS
jgi:sugar/nucleoside kinase (ribokinase family)